MLVGRTSRDVSAWNARVALAERLNARVVTDLKIAASFPTSHHLHAGAPGGTVLAPEAAEAIRSADVILSLDWLDVAGTFKAVGNVTAKVIQVSVDHQLTMAGAWTIRASPPVDVFIDCEPDARGAAVARGARAGTRARAAARGKDFPKPSDGKLTVDHLAPRCAKQSATVRSA